MSPMLAVYIDDDTDRRLRAAAKETHRSVEDLVECAVAETALDYERSRNFELEHGGNKG